MLMKQSLLLFFTIILLNLLKNECEAIQCYSCSDCNNLNKSNWTIISTVNSGDQCIRATMSSGKYTYRGASTQCHAYTSNIGSILCCRSDLCNA